MLRRVWDYTDTACGHSPTTDPDDCLAVLVRDAAGEIELAGISPVYSNASLEVTDATTRKLARVLANDGMPMPRLWPGAASPRTSDPLPTPSSRCAAHSQKDRRRCWPSDL